MHPQPPPSNPFEGQLPPIIALCGPAGSGKSTLARALADLAPSIEISVPISDGADGGQTYATGRLPTAGVVIPLAAPLKAMLATLGVPADNLAGSEKDQPCDLLCGRTARHAMQTLGTEWGRECIHPELWLRAWEARARRSHGFASLIIVDDLRFDNERTYLEKLGAIVIRVFREGVHYDGRHASERGPATYHGGVELVERAEDDAPDAWSTDLAGAPTMSATDRRNASATLEAAVTASARRWRGQPDPLRWLLEQGARTG